MPSNVIPFCAPYKFGLILNSNAGGLGAATFLLLCGYLGTSTVTAVTFLTLSTAFAGVGLSGYHVNHLDIAPRFAGVIMGITNLASVLSGIVAPQVAKAIAIEVGCRHSLSILLTAFPGHILQTIKYWRWEWPGNEATLMQ